MAEIKVLGGTNQTGVNLYTGEEGSEGTAELEPSEERDMAALLMSN